MHKVYVVITTISSPNDALKAISKGCREHGFELIIIGDRKTPANFKLDYSRYFSLDDQIRLGYDLAESCPENHYSRKNIGYLIAMKEGADIIIETDDDNIPYDNFWKIPSEEVTGDCYEKDSGWVNIYKHFTDTTIWPRGFPLENIKKNNYSEVCISPENIAVCPIQQSLADDNPDVDALYRLTFPLPVKFEKGKNIILGENTWSPFNSQNTIWFKKAFPLMYLPSFCSFRMTDIWRSLIAQRIAWEYGWSVKFSSPTMYQKRNEHNLLKDFEQEISGYLQNNKIKKTLQNCKFLKANNFINEMMIDAYKSLSYDGYLDINKEIPLLEKWLNEFSL
jgi:hypothetical protein